jgi:hypothetical protein
MKEIELTCVSCGKTKKVEDLPEEKRDETCECGQPMIEKRHPGNSE